MTTNTAQERSFSIIDFICSCRVNSLAGPIIVDSASRPVIFLRRIDATGMEPAHRGVSGFRPFDQLAIVVQFAAKCSAPRCDTAKIV